MGSGPDKKQRARPAYDKAMRHLDQMVAASPAGPIPTVTQLSNAAGVGRETACLALRDYVVDTEMARSVIGRIAHGVTPSTLRLPAGQGVATYNRLRAAQILIDPRYQPTAADTDEDANYESRGRENVHDQR